MIMPTKLNLYVNMDSMPRRILELFPLILMMMVAQLWTIPFNRGGDDVNEKILVDAKMNFQTLNRVRNVNRFE